LNKNLLGGNGLTDDEVAELNNFFGKHYSKESWANLNTLYLPELPNK